jgi:hypothetical protein
MNLDKAMANPKLSAIVDQMMASGNEYITTVVAQAVEVTEDSPSPEIAFSQIIGLTHDDWSQLSQVETLTLWVLLLTRMAEMEKKR